MTFKTPSGQIPWANSVNISTAPGSFSEGFKTKVFPATMAKGYIFQKLQRKKGVANPKRNHGWEIERTNTSADTKGCLVADNIDVGSDVLGRLSEEGCGAGQSELNNFQTTENISFGISLNLAQLFGDAFSDLIQILVNTIAVAD